MITPENFKRIVAAIQAQGYDEATAGHYAALIGDTPRLDADGNILVIDETGKEIARVKRWKFADE